MPQLTDQPPLSIQSELDALNRSLDQVIPKKVIGQNLLVATWNIRSFASLTRKCGTTRGALVKLKILCGAQGVAG
jgi:hypothetical protein